MDPVRHGVKATLAHNAGKLAKPVAPFAKTPYVKPVGIAIPEVAPAAAASQSPLLLPRRQIRPAACLKALCRSNYGIGAVKALSLIYPLSFLTKRNSKWEEKSILTPSGS